jgi:hypothetical protein
VKKVKKLYRYIYRYIERSSAFEQNIPTILPSPFVLGGLWEQMLLIILLIVGLE